MIEARRPAVLNRMEEGGITNHVLETALGCIFALGCWKASKENWFVAFIGVAFLAWALKFARRIPFPSDIAVCAGAFGVVFGVMATTSPLWEYTKKYTAERMKKYAAEIEAKKTPPRQQS